MEGTANSQSISTADNVYSSITKMHQGLYLLDYVRLKNFQTTFLYQDAFFLKWNQTDCIYVGSFWSRTEDSFILLIQRKMFFF